MGDVVAKPDVRFYPAMDGSSRKRGYSVAFSLQSSLFKAEGLDLDFRVKTEGDFPTLRSPEYLG